MLVRERRTPTLLLFRGKLLAAELGGGGGMEEGRGGMETAEREAGLRVVGLELAGVVSLLKLRDGIALAVGVGVGVGMGSAAAAVVVVMVEGGGPDGGPATAC